MNTLNDTDDIPFVNEECGDTMWDEDRLNQLTQVVISHPYLDIASVLETVPPVQKAAEATNTEAVE